MNHLNKEITRQFYINENGFNEVERIWKEAFRNGVRMDGRMHFVYAAIRGKDWRKGVSKHWPDFPNGKRWADPYVFSKDFKTPFDHLLVSNWKDILFELIFTEVFNYTGPSYKVHDYDAYMGVPGHYTDRPMTIEEKLKQAKIRIAQQDEERRQKEIERLKQISYNSDPDFETKTLPSIMKQEFSVIPPSAPHAPYIFYHEDGSIEFRFKSGAVYKVGPEDLQKILAPTVDET